MSKPSPTPRNRPPPRPGSIFQGNGEAPQSGSPVSSPLLGKKVLFVPSSPKTPPRSPIGQPKFVQHSERSLNSEPLQTVSDTFGLCLQTARDRINARHDCELQALENFRAYVRKRAKADGEYAATLAKIQGHTLREMAGLGTDSPIVQVWKGVLESMESIQEKYCSVSKHVEKTLLCSIDELIKEKIGFKRAYDISRSKLDDEYRESCNQVQNLRRMYLHWLEVTETTKRKLEDALKKPVTKPDEIDKLRRKFVKGAQHLHTCHNDYTLSILNANCHMRHYNTSLMPFCLDTLQERMELFVTQWKDVMEDYALTTDMSKVYEESYKKVFTYIQQLEPKQEYTAFIQENKCDPVDEDDYIFDTSLLKAYCSPSVEASKMSINNLTHEKLVAELAAMEQKLDVDTKEQTEKAQKLSQLKGASFAEKDYGSQIPHVTEISSLQAELKYLQCKIERKKLKLQKLKEDVNELNGNPPPLFDKMGEGVLVTTDFSIASDDRHNPSDSGVSAKTIRKKLKGIMTWINQKSHSLSNESASGPSDVDKVQEKDINDDEDDDCTYETMQPAVESEPWFYPDMERKAADIKCKNTGDYLVRYSSKQNKYILSVNWGGQGRHFIIQETGHVGNKEKMYYFESQQFPSIRELLDFLVKSQTPVTKVTGALLINPVINDDKWLLIPDEIKKIKDLGKGEFGEVYEAELHDCRVAVKACRSTDAKEKDRFFQEVELLKHYDHPNVVKLIGFCWDTEPLIVMELMVGGSLLKYLKKNRARISQERQLHMAIDACSGMTYLESKRCIHRDLAARNCLVGDNEIVKISDFGMSHDDCDAYDIQGTKQIPIKWTAPEALNRGRYILASDVWSYGVLLWEVFSYGTPPYPGMSNQEAKDQIDKGYRMPPPTGCPESIYNIMMLCWKYESDDRPKFSELYSMLTELKI